MENLATFTVENQFLWFHKKRGKKKITLKTENHT